MKKYILTIDQGTTSSRAILFNKSGEIVTKYQMEFTQIRRKSGYVEHNANEIYDTVLECIKNVLNNSNIDINEVDSIGITNQRETTVLFDKAGNPLCNAICWQSRQSTKICDDLIKRGYKDFIYERTGLFINPYFSASKIKYILDNYPDVYKKYLDDDCLFGTIDTFILYKLTNGKSFYTDPTNASRTMLYNIHTLSWDQELLDLFNIDKKILPTVLNSSDNFGYYEYDGALIPICSLIGDQQSSLFGHAMFNSGEIKNTYGTGCFMLLNTGDEIVKSKNGLLSTIAYKINDKVCYALEGSVFVAGAGVGFLRDGLKIIESSKETQDRALSVVGHDVIVVPAFTGLATPYWRNDVRGAIFGMSLNTNQNQIIKGVLDSIAYQSKDVIEVMKMEANLQNIALSVDGGASMNDYLMQFQADIMQLVVKRPRQFETTALGACFLAGLYTGFFKDLDEIKKINKVDKIFYPIMDINESDELYKKWQMAVNACCMYNV